MPSNTYNTTSHPTLGNPEPRASHRFSRLHAIAAAVVLCTGLAHLGDANALALGRIVVQSALGEPLKAEIDVPDINPEEASSLRVGLASSEAFRAAGMDFNSALSNLQISLQRRANGTAYLQLSSTRPVNEPFVDIIVEANWASGRMVRDYTLLLDPPKLRAAAPVSPLPAATSAPAQPAVQAPAAPASAAVPPARAPDVAIPTPPPAPAVRPQAPAAAPAPVAIVEEPSASVAVRAGDTAGRIAAANRSPNVSLDQMLVALLRANPKAFIEGNVNLIKAGSVLELPSESAASGVSAQEARRIIVAQSRDFNEYRRRLAETVPTASVAAADRETSGRIQTEVEEQKPIASGQDKLTLSKGVADAQVAAADKIAQERRAQEASTRVAELSKNIEDLAKLGSSTAPPGAANASGTQAPPTATTPTLPGVTVPALSPVAPPTPATAETPLPTDPAIATAPATEASASTEAPPVTPVAPVTPVTPPEAKPAPVPAPEEPSLMDGLLDNPLVLPAAGGLLALLAGFAFIRFRRRKHETGVDSSFMESRLQPDSFFGASGGQRVNTLDSNLSDSSMVYSPSQLDAAGVVDPVAEADVYLAYGRDYKAEEILKEAMNSTPQRVAIHSKLLGIYAKRRDVKAFESVASDVYDLTMGQGPEWDQACVLGRELDPTNSLYEPGGRRTTKASLAPNAKTAATSTQQPSPSKPAPGLDAAPSTISGPISLDLDLDFSMDEPAPPPAPAKAPAPTPAPLAATSTLRMDAPSSPASAPVAPLAFDMDFSLDTPPSGSPSQNQPSASPPPPPASAPAQATSLDLPELELGDMPQFELPSKKQTPPPVAAPAASSSAFDANADMLSFDLGDLSPSLPESNAPQAAEAPSKPGEENPLETKLALAEEFRSIGFMEGARSLAEEVLAEATGTLKTKASKFLADLS